MADNSGIVKLMLILILCLRSVAHGLFKMVLLRASTLTPGLNDSSPSQTRNQIRSPDMARLSMLPHPKKGTYI